MNEQSRIKSVNDAFLKLQSIVLILKQTGVVRNKLELKYTSKRAAIQQILVKDRTKIKSVIIYFIEQNLYAFFEFKNRIPVDS